MGLNKELKAGDKVQIELTFKNAGSITVEAEVRDGSNSGGH
jgi:copper(I)-binding protein